MVTVTGSLWDIISFSQKFFILFWPLLPTHCRCRGLLLQLITLN